MKALEYRTATMHYMTLMYNNIEDWERPGDEGARMFGSIKTRRIECIQNIII